jgi:hypothetical protein
MMTFRHTGEYLIEVFRTIVMFVVLVALLFVAYCLLRLLALAFHFVNSQWFVGHEGMGLILTATVVLVVGWLVPLFHRRRRLDRTNGSTTLERFDSRPRTQPEQDSQHAEDWSDHSPS